MIPSYTPPVKTAISIPEQVFRRVEEQASRLGMSRSEFFTRAASRWLDELDDKQETAAINAVLAEAGPQDDDIEFVTHAARLLLAAEQEA